MSDASKQRGCAPVGLITELSEVEAASVIYFRLWCDSAKSQSHVWNDFASHFGPTKGRETFQTFEELCRVCARHGRRPLMRHSVDCKCLGADEACFANFIAAAADGQHEDAMLIATLLVRADFAPLAGALARDFGLALKRMKLRPPQKGNLNSTRHVATSSTLH